MSATNVAATSAGFALGGPPGAVAGSLIESGVSAAYNMFAADQNRDFQRDMANTAHQRQVKDLKAAGLNPILSAKYGGAATPSGSQAAPPTFDATNKAIQAASAKATIANTEANTRKADAEAKLAQISADTESSLTVERLVSRRAELLTLSENYGLTQDKRQHIKGMLEHIDAQIQKLELESQHSSLGLEKAEKEADFWAGKGGTIAPYIREVVGPSARSAADLIDTGMDTIKKWQGIRKGRFGGPKQQPRDYRDGVTSDANEAAYKRTRKPSQRWLDSN